MSNATLLELIGARHEDLRNSEKAVADLVLADPVRAMEFKLAGLADAAGVFSHTISSLDRARRTLDPLAVIARSTCSRPRRR